MTENEAIELLRSMQNPKQDYANLVCATAFCTGYRYVYPEPEDYAIEEAISALKEVQQYRDMNRKLREEYGDCDGLLEMAVEGLCKHSCVDIGSPKKSRLLTDEDVDKWDAYSEIGTVEECREAVEKQKAKKRIYPKTALERYYHAPECPNCKRELKPRICGYTLSQAIGIYSYCPWCGQNLEGVEESEE